MKVGFGSTVWCKGLVSGKLDGIGIYSKNIYQNISNRVDLQPIVFNKLTEDNLKKCDFSNNLKVSGTKFSIYTFLNGVLNIPYNSLEEYQDGIDIFFAPDHYIPYFKRVPVVATVMDLIPIIHPQWTSPTLRKAKNYLFTKTIKEANHIITISEHSKKDIVEVLNIEPQKVDVVDLGVNREFFKRIDAPTKQKILRKYGIKEGFFLFIGTLQPRKNLIRLIKAHKKLPKDIKENYPLIIVGQYGWRGEDFLEEIKKLEERGDGKWLSYIPQNDIYVILQSALAVVYPSLYEGFGLPILESFASNVPIITSNTTSIPEVASGASLMVNPYSIDDISKAMKEIAFKPSLRESLTKAGQERVKRYSWDRVANKHIDIFKKVIDRCMK